MTATKNVVTVTGRDFGYSVKFLKKAGYTFDAASKSWAGEGNIEFLLANGYVTPVSRSKPQPDPEGHDYDIHPAGKPSNGDIVRNTQPASEPKIRYEVRYVSAPYGIGEDGHAISIHTDREEAFVEESRLNSTDPYYTGNVKVVKTIDGKKAPLYDDAGNIL